MKAAQSLKNLYQQRFVFKAQESHFEHLQHTKSGRNGQEPILGHMYPWDSKAHKLWHTHNLKDP